MMRALVALCVRHFGTVTALTVVALVLGSWSALRSPLDVFPEFVPSQVTIQTEAPGFAPQQVEELITKPIENAVNGAAGLATLRSESIPGLSVVNITFTRDVDVHIARQGISERLSELGSTLPAGVGTPKLSPLVSSTMDLLKIGLLSDRVDGYALRDAADWVIKPRLLAVPGVAHVIVFGGRVRQIQVLPDTGKLASYNITMSEVADAARTALSLRGAGFIDLAAQRVLIRSPTPEPDIAAISEAVIAVRNGTPVLLRDVATVEQAPALRFGDALVMGKPGVFLSLASQYGANTLSVTLAVERALAALEPALKAQGITVYPALHRPANFIERALGNLQQSLGIAVILILALLYLFLRDIRAALIAFSAIPLSLLAAVAVLDRMGMTLNTMTLGGFAVALGVLVDDAIIGIENIMRRLRENARLEAPRPRLEIIRDASLEVRGPVIYATLVVIVVFLPVLFTSSIQGRFVGPLALSFIFAVVASLVVALTSTPALCALLLRRHDERPEARWLQTLKVWQRRSVQRIGAHLKLTMLVLIGLVVVAVGALPFLGGTFMPDFREGHFVLQVSSSIPGTSLDEMLALGKRISAEVLALPYVKTIEQQVGRAELGEDTWGPHRSEFHVELKPDAQVDQEEPERRDGAGRHQGVRRRPGRARCDRRQGGRGSRQGQGHRRSAVQATERHSRARNPALPAGTCRHRPQGPGRSRHRRNRLRGCARRADVPRHAHGRCGRAAAGSRAPSVGAARAAHDREPARTCAALTGRPHRCQPGPLQHRARRRAAAHQRDVQRSRGVAPERGAGSPARHCQLGQAARGRLSRVHRRGGGGAADPQRAHVVLRARPGADS